MLVLAQTTFAFIGLNGFLGSRATLMMDVVVVAMVAILAVMGYSIQLAKRGQYQRHKQFQIGLAIVLFLAVTAFEIDVRFVSGWTDRAEPSPYYSTWVYPSLYLHLAFSVSTPVLWIFVIVQALRKIPNPPSPCAYSTRHILWAKLAAIDLFLTTLTGWVFYYLAFVA